MARRGLRKSKGRKSLRQRESSLAPPESTSLAPPTRPSVAPVARASTRPPASADADEPPRPSVQTAPTVQLAASAEAAEPTAAHPRESAWGHHDDHDALSANFFSTPPVAPAVEHWDDEHPPPVMAHGSRRAMIATAIIFAVSLAFIGGYTAYHSWFMPEPVELGGPLGATLPTPLPPASMSMHRDVPSAPVAAAAPPMPTPAAALPEVAPPSAPLVTAPVAAPVAAPVVAPVAQPSAVAHSPARAVAPVSHPGELAHHEVVVGTYGDLMSAAQALNRRGQHKEALDAYHRALAVNPRGADVMSRIAYIHLNRGENKLAKEYAARAVDASPSNSEGWIVLGAALAALGDHAGAQAAYHKCAVLGSGTYARECQQLAH